LIMGPISHSIRSRQTTILPPTKAKKGEDGVNRLQPYFRNWHLADIAMGLKADLR